MVLACLFRRQQAKQNVLEQEIENEPQIEQIANTSDNSHGTYSSDGSGNKII